MTNTTSSSEMTPARPTPNMPPDHLGLLVAAFLLMIMSWGGLVRLMQMPPRIGGELWLFFILLQVAISSTAMPFIRYLNVRFTPLEAPVPTSGVIVRQSVWVGLFVVTCAWLQIPRALTLPVALFIAAMFVIVEVFLRFREMAGGRR